MVRKNNTATKAKDKKLSDKPNQVKRRNRRAEAVEEIRRLEEENRILREKLAEIDPTKDYLPELKPQGKMFVNHISLYGEVGTEPVDVKVAENFLKKNYRNYPFVFGNREDTALFLKEVQALAHLFHLKKRFSVAWPDFTEEMKPDEYDPENAKDFYKYGEKWLKQLFNA